MKYVVIFLKYDLKMSKWIYVKEKKKKQIYLCRMDIEKFE